MKKSFSNSAQKFDARKAAEALAGKPMSEREKIQDRITNLRHKASKARGEGRLGAAWGFEQTAKRLEQDMPNLLIKAEQAAIKRSIEKLKEEYADKLLMKDPQAQQAHT